MTRLIPLLLALSISSILAKDLRSDLQAAGVTAVFPGDSGYPSASEAFNLRFTFKPVAVSFPATPEQVSSAVKLGSSYGHHVAARSGGHSYIANGLGGSNGVLVVDMRNFTKVSVDAGAGTATIEIGNRLGNVALALNDAGRALPHGTCPYVGLGGHSGYGGFGFTSRMWGMTLDTIRSIHMVLPNGTITTASNTSNSDLFWAMRGSAGSFGITTAIEVTTFEAPPSATFYQYTWNMNVQDAANAMAKFQTYVETNIPPQLGGELVITKGSVRGNVTFALVGAWYGPSAQLNSTLAPYLTSLAPPRNISLQSGTYIESVANIGGGPLDTTAAPDKNDTFYAKSLMTPEKSPMSNSALRAFASYMANQGFDSNTNWFVEVELYGGKNSAINAVAPDATAFAHRSSMFTIQFYASSESGLPPYPTSGLSFLDGMVNSITSNSPPNWDYGAYPNYIDSRLKDWQWRYYGRHYERLRSLKKMYDPRDLFDFPTAIED
ncbi:glucooligosaccharide oxidase [Infundibulicybe gibba]|nr:glucooligosaccharide oxidase [Infundibulicybe gibba]